ncbi:esterase/lipase family protein [Nocardioides sp. NPDC051685]|uniref:esterase/lipase family protein n=1 Tax=Nocardioides sp. NPDC051685 TaxID=3364334 RepID=UPI0037953867
MVLRSAVICAAVMLSTVPTLLAAAPAQAAGGVNDAACRPSADHPNAVVFLHGLGANKGEDLNFLQDDVAKQGYCTYSLTYGAGAYGPFVGGVGDIARSATQIKAFIQDVLTQTGAAKVDLVGHSEGGFQTLYVTKTQGIADRIDNVVAIAPPTHGTSFAGLYELGMTLGADDLAGQVLTAFGCVACTQLVTDGSAVRTLANGPIAQRGVTYTIIQSRYDELVTPTETAFVREPGVTNTYVQDVCPYDPVGHIGEAYDTNVWHLVKNALDPAGAAPFACSVGSPG